MLVVERGHFLPREPENTQPEHMFIRKRYTTAEPWFDGATGKPFQPGVYYWVGGNTKLYGACLPRFRRSDFNETSHHDGVSPAWPFTYDDLEPFYAQAEQLYQVHGQVGEDPAEPRHSTPYPFPCLEHEPTIERLADSLRAQGLHPFHMSNGMNLDTLEDRRADATSDGSPSPTGKKSDAENRAIVPALQSGNVRLLLDARVQRLVTNGDGSRVVGAETYTAGRTGPDQRQGVRRLRWGRQLRRPTVAFSLACPPEWAGRISSGRLGRNYMVHNSTFFMGVNPLRRNPTAWQKTLGLNDWYEAGPDNDYSLGNLQMLGKLQAPMVKSARPWAPMWALKLVTDRSLDIYLTTEDLPRAENRVTVDGDRIVVHWTPNNLPPHFELVKQI